MLSATRSRWGQRLGQKKAVPKKTELMKIITTSKLVV